jgi:hypothetical protein
MQFFMKITQGSNDVFHALKYLSHGFFDSITPFTFTLARVASLSSGRRFQSMRMG